MAALMGFTAVSGLAARNASVSGSRIVAMPTTTSQPVRSFNVEAAHKKGTGSTKNGRDSNAKYLGVKKYGGEQVTTGNIIIRQRGNKVRDRDVAWDPSDPPAKTLKPCESCPFYPPRPRRARARSPTRRPTPPRERPR